MRGYRISGVVDLGCLVRVVIRVTIRIMCYLVGKVKGVLPRGRPRMFNVSLGLPNFVGVENSDGFINNAFNCISETGSRACICQLLQQLDESMKPA